MSNLGNDFSPVAVERVSKKASGLPPAAAHNYVETMLGELCEIASGAELIDLEAILKVTLTAVAINGRFR